MKTRKLISLALALMFAVTAFASFAAVASPQGFSIRGVSNNVKVKQLAATVLKDAKIKADIEKAADDFAKTEYANDPRFEKGYTVVKLLELEVRATITGNQPGTVEIKCADAKIGDEIFVVIRKANGTKKYVKVKITKNGIVEVEIEGNCTVAICEVVPEGESAFDDVDVTLPSKK